MSAIKQFNLDLYKEGLTSKNFMSRQGENGQQIKVTLTENGVKTNLTSSTVWLKGITPDDKFIKISANVYNDVATVTLNKDWNSQHGTFKHAYLEVLKGSNVITTQSINWLVLPNATVTGKDEAHYVDELQRVIDNLQNEVTKTLNDFNNQMATAKGDIKQLELDIVDINKRIASALEEFEKGDFYTKGEADTKFLTADKLPKNIITSDDLATGDKAGIVYLGTVITQPPANRVTSLSLFKTHLDNRNNPHGVTPSQINALDLSSLASTQHVGSNVNFKKLPTVNTTPVATNDGAVSYFMKWKNYSWVNLENLHNQPFNVEDSFVRAGLATETIQAFEKTSDGKGFTCRIAGKYLITGSMIVQFPKGFSSKYFYTNLIKNGAVNSGLKLTAMGCGTNTLITNRWTFAGQAVITLAVGDVIDIRGETNGGTLQVQMENIIYNAIPIV